MPHLGPEFVCQALGLGQSIAQATQLDGQPFTAIVTDSRKIIPGCLFVALTGEKFDGHAFVPQAVAAGARGILCRRGTSVEARKGLLVFEVEDTLDAYRRLAGAWRREFSIPLVAVAGSVGKTTTKELLTAVLRGRWPEVLRTEGSQNGFVGIPMTLLELNPTHGAAVIEIGIDEPGAMAQHMPLVAPGAAVLTLIAPEHLEKLIDLPTVAREEGIALTSVAQTGGLAAINLDDPWVRPFNQTLRSGRKVTYTLSIEKHPEATLSGRVADGRLEVAGLSPGPVFFELPLPGIHNAGNLMAAIAVAHGLGLTAAQMAAGLGTFRGAAGRSELKELAGPTPVLCDYYNASPPSMAAGLATLSEIAQTHHAVARRACLGDMLELGAGEEAFHRELAGPILQMGIEQVLLYGPRMKWLANELATRGYTGALSHHASHEELSQRLLASAHPGDAIFIKGSHSMRMEEVWRLLQLGWPHGART